MTTKDDKEPVLRGLESIRKRPGMYVGGTGAEGLHHLLWEVVGNVVDQHLARAATELHVDVTDDGWIAVSDDGPGISTRPYPGTEASTLEIVFTKLAAGGHTDLRRTAHVHLSPTLNGAGVGSVNALSARTEVETTRDGQRWAIAFERGPVATPLRSLGPTTREGTTLRFRPDPQIFRTTVIDLELVRAHLQQVAWLSPLLRVFLQGRRVSGRGGLRGWAEQLAGGTPEASFSTEQRVDDVYVDLALAWRGDRDPVIHSFVNMHSSPAHGTHVQGLQRAFAACAKDLGVSRKVFSACVEPGLIAMVHVGMFAPRWGNPMKDQLVSPVAGEVVAKVLIQELVAEKTLRTFFERRLDRGA